MAKTTAKTPLENANVNEPLVYTMARFRGSLGWSGIKILFLITNMARTTTKTPLENEPLRLQTLTIEN